MTSQNAAMFPLQPPGQESEPSAGPGVCVNDKLRSLSAGMNPFRFARGALRFTANGVGASLILTAASEALTLFDKGVEEASSDAGLAAFGASLTRTDTDASKDGAFVPNKFVFEMMGMGIILGTPIAKPTTGDGVGRRYWHRFYDEELQAMVIEHAAIGVKWPDGQSLDYEAGPLGLWPGHGGFIGASKGANGRPIVAAFMPFRAAVNNGGRSSDDKLEIIVRVPRNVEIQSSPVPSEQTQADDVYVPFHVVLFGRPLNSGSAE
jgi:hypothetical protein